MNKAKHMQSGGMMTILIVGLLLAVAGGLYLQLIMHPSDTPPTVAQVTEPTASIQIVEGSESAVLEVATADAEQPLPEDQMAMIMQIFAPETAR